MSQALKFLRLLNQGLTQEGIKVPIWISRGFQQRDRQDSQNLNNDTFYRPPVTSTHCIIGTEKHPDSAILLNYDDDDDTQGYGQIKALCFYRR